MVQPVATTDTLRDRSAWSVLWADGGGRLAPPERRGREARHLSQEKGVCRSWRDPYGSVVDFWRCTTSFQRWPWHALEETSASAYIASAAPMARMQRWMRGHTLGGARRKVHPHAGVLHTRTLPSAFWSFSTAARLLREAPCLHSSRRLLLLPCCQVYID